MQLGSPSYRLVFVPFEWYLVTATGPNAPQERAS